MKVDPLLSCCLLLGIGLLSLGLQAKKQRPNDFVDVSSVIPQIQIDMRYYSNHNFTGEKVKGYQAPVCLLTRPAVDALHQVEKSLLTMGLTLKMYDCYRPQQAVDFFYQWAQQAGHSSMKQEFYPTLDKKTLFEQNYVATKSGHSRGSTMDLTIVPIDSHIPVYDPAQALVSCTAEQKDRFPDNSLDFGTGYDCFSPLSHPDNLHLSPQAKANRLLLRTLMTQAGFTPYPTEWWHFTLEKEPYPDTYFDFPVR